MSGVPLEPDPRSATRALAERLHGVPDAHVVLGSGLGSVADAVEDAVVVPFSHLPGFPEASVEGHAGRFVAGRLEGRSVIVQQGRIHVYEGHPAGVVALPVRAVRGLGVDTLVVTNAAGGIRAGLEPGMLVLLEDHLNLQFRSPLIGPVAEGETRFPDMTVAYDPELRALAVKAAERLGIPLARGVYAALTGPSFETPAEIRMLARLGADVVGMSTVPEVIAARAGGMRCLGVSLVTNVAAGLSGEPLDHAEVMEVGRTAGERMERLLRAVIRDLPSR